MSEPSNDKLDLVADIVAAFLSNNSMPRRVKFRGSLLPFTALCHWLLLARLKSRQSN